MEQLPETWEPSQIKKIVQYVVSLPVAFWEGLDSAQKPDDKPDFKTVWS